MNLKVGDVVGLDDAFGNSWTDGVITIIRPDDGIYVRWPDGKIGIFEHRHAKYLKRKESP